MIVNGARPGRDAEALLGAGVGEVDAPVVGRTGMPPSEVTQSASSSASPLPAPSGAMSDRTPVEVSAWTAAISFGRRVGGEHALDVDRLPPLVLDGDDLGAAAGGDVDHPLAEQAVDRDDDDVARLRRC